MGWIIAAALGWIVAGSAILWTIFRFDTRAERMAATPAPDPVPSNVISMEERQRAKWGKMGRTTFMQCGCGSDLGLVPVVVHEPKQFPLIVALVCPNCETEVLVENGRI